MQNASHRTHFRVSCITSCVGGQTPVLTRNSRAQKKHCQPRHHAKASVAPIISLEQQSSLVKGEPREGAGKAYGPGRAQRGCPGAVRALQKIGALQMTILGSGRPGVFPGGGVGPIEPRSAEEGSVGRGWAIKSRCLPSSSKQGAIEARL